jgi:hypothetical protein
MNKMIADIALESRSALYFLFRNIAASRKLKKDLVLFKKFARELIKNRLEEIEKQNTKS